MNGSEIFISNGGYSRTRAAAILFWTLTTGYRPFGSSALDPKIRLGRDDFRGARTLACRVETRLDACRSLRRRQASTRVSRRQARVPAPHWLWLRCSAPLREIIPYSCAPPPSPAEAVRQPREPEVNNGRGVERQHLAEDQPADNGDSQRPAKLRADTRAERQWNAGT